MSTPDGKRISYTVQQAADALGCSADVIRRAVRAGYLTPLKVRGTTLRVFDAAEVRALLIPDQDEAS